MILVDLNQEEVVLQIFAQNIDGSRKLDVSSGSVRVYHLDGVIEIEDLASTALVQIGSTNVWRYVWEPATLPVAGYIAEYTLTDTFGVVTSVGEDIIVRDIARQETLADVRSRILLIQDDLMMVRKVETGRWKIVANQMIFYEDDDATPMLTFDLKDDLGLPSMNSVFERMPVGS